MEIRQAKLHEPSAVVMLVQALWPHHTTNELREELLPLQKRGDAAFFLAFGGAIRGACMPWAGHCPGAACTMREMGKIMRLC